jgi:pimeloyl-ACP methyl ester carboxylesterase
MQVIVNGLLTTYTISGSGPALLVLHGWADSHARFTPLAARLGKHYTVILLDLPGFGGSQAPAQPWGLPEYSAFVRDFSDKIKQPPQAVAGHSNGGAIAVYAVAHSILSPAKLVLLGSAGIRNHGQGRKQMLKLVAKAGKVAAAPLPKSVQRRLRGTLYKAAGSDYLVAGHLQESFKLVVGYDIQQEASQVDIPTLVIYGEQDQETPVWMAERLHQALPNSTLEILPDAGHFVFEDRPDEVYTAIERFLK